MAIAKILESQGVVQTPRDGALLNYIMVGKKDGRLCGAELYHSTPETVNITKGVLMVRGYRIVIEQNEELFNTTNHAVPDVPTKYNIILSIAASENNAIVVCIVRTTPPFYVGKIEETTGRYDYLIGHFEYSIHGIRLLTDKTVQL